MSETYTRRWKFTANSSQGARGRKKKEAFHNPGTGWPESQHLAFGARFPLILVTGLKIAINDVTNGYFQLLSLKKKVLKIKKPVTFTWGTTISTFHFLWNLSFSLCLSFQTVVPDSEHHRRAIKSHESRNDRSVQSPLSCRHTSNWHVNATTRKLQNTLRCRYEAAKMFTLIPLYFFPLSKWNTRLAAIHALSPMKFLVGVVTSTRRKRNRNLSS